jgi:hypothetical protein
MDNRSIDNYIYIKIIIESQKNEFIDLDMNGKAYKF